MSTPSPKWWIMSGVSYLSFPKVYRSSSPQSLDLEVAKVYLTNEGMCDIHIVTTRCPTPPFPFPMTPLRGHRVPFFGLAQHAVLPEKGYPKLAGSFADMWHSEPCKLPSRLCRRILCAS